MAVISHRNCNRVQNNPKRTLVHRSKNTITSIDEVWLAVSVDREDNTEGVCAISTPMGMMPLMAADPKQYKFVRQQAKRMSREKGIIIQVIKLTTRDVVETFDGAN